MKKRMIRLLVMGVVTGLSLSMHGCQSVPTQGTAAVSDTMTEFAGGGVGFSYDASSWRVSGTERWTEGSIISVYNQENQSLMALASYLRDEAREKDLFTDVRERDSYLGIMDEKTDRQTEADIRRHTLTYWVEDESTDSGKRYIYAAVYRYQDSQAIAIMAEYYHEEDRAGIEQLLATLVPSEEDSIEEVLETLQKDRHPGDILDNFIYFYNGDYERVQEEILANVDKTFRAKSGYEYLFDVEMAGYTGNVYPVVMPEEAYYDGSYLSYYEHGITFYANIAQLTRSGQTVADYLQEQVTGDLDYYRTMPRDYSNIVESSIQEKGDAVWQVVQVDYVDDYSNTETQTKIYYAGKLSDDEVLSWTIALQPYGSSYYSSYYSGVDGATYLVIQELFKAYEMPADTYEMEQPEMTASGAVVEPGQEIYSRPYSGPVIEALDDYNLIGEGQLEYGEYKSKVSVPRGKYTTHYEDYITFEMYGLSGEAELWENYYDQPSLEYAVEQLGYTYDYHKESTKYYQELSELKEITGLPDDMTAASFSEYYVDYDNSRYLVYHLVMCQKLESGALLTIELQLDTSQLSAETAEVLRQYGEVLGVDFYELMERDGEDPLAAF